MKMRCCCSCLSKAPEAPELVVLSVTGRCCEQSTALAGPGPAPSLVASSGGHLGMHKGAWWQRPCFREEASPRFNAMMAFLWHLLSLHDYHKLWENLFEN